MIVKNILVDVDGVLSDLYVEWLKRYNKDFNDTLMPSDLKIWGLDKLVKPECGKKIFSYLDQPDLYDNIQVIEDSLEGINWIRNKGYRVLFVSSGVGGAFAKFNWLTRNKFNPGKWGEDFINAQDKFLIKGLLLIDDRDKNIIDYRSSKSILFDAPYNQELDWHNRAHCWAEVITILKRELP